MENIVFAKYDIDSGCVYAWTEDHNLILINCDTVEKNYANNMYQRAELDYLIYNDPAAYAELVLAGDVKGYLDTVRQGQ